MTLFFILIQSEKKNNYMYLYSHYLLYSICFLPTHTCMEYVSSNE
jgi:hypothetical protein